MQLIKKKNHLFLFCVKTNFIRMKIQLYFKTFQNKVFCWFPGINLIIVVKNCIFLLFTLFYK